MCLFVLRFFVCLFLRVFRLCECVCLEPGNEKRTSLKRRWAQSRKNRLGKRSEILRSIPEEETNSDLEDRFGRCVQQSAIQTADGAPRTLWRQLDAQKMARNGTPGKKGRHTTDNGSSTRLLSVPSPLLKGTVESEQQWLKPDTCACG